MTRARVLIVAAVVAIFVIGVAYLTGRGTGGGGSAYAVNVSVTAGKSMFPQNLRAKQSDTLTINIKSDIDGEVHLHGYDIAFNAKAGQVVSHTFKADKTGTFDIEWETTGKLLGDLTVSP